MNSIITYSLFFRNKDGPDKFSIKDVLSVLRV